jgi:hypothetical protein
LSAKFAQRNITSGVEFPNFSDIIIGEFGHSMMFATRVGAMKNAVALVLSWCAVSQIHGAVVCADAIAMADLKPVRAWSNKEDRNESMNWPRETLVVTAKSDTGVSIAVRGRLKPTPFCANLPSAAVWTTEHDLLPARPHTAIIADAVAGEFGNIAVFNCDRGDRIGIRHGLLLRKRVVLDAGAVFQHDPASLLYGTTAATVTALG